MSETEIIDVDVLVVGGGAAGCRAAIEAANRGAKTVLVTKGRVGRSGCSPQALMVSGVGPWSDPKDSVELFMEDCVRAGEYMADQELARVLFSEVGERYMELEKWGAYWAKREDGTLDLVRKAGHSVARTFHMAAPFTGRIVMNILKSELLRLGVEIIEDTMVTNLLTWDGSVVGATALDYMNGVFKVFRAKSTILATGHCEQIFLRTTVGREGTGEGIAMAFRAGAELIDMENHLLQGIGPGSLCLHPRMYMINFAGRKWSGILPVGGGTFTPRYLNAKGEEFLKRFVPPAPVAPKTLRLLAHAREVEEGRATPEGGVYLDVRDAPNLEEILEDAKMKIVFERANIDLTKDLLEIGIAAHANTGGIRVNVRSETTVPGLYAAGGCAAPYYGWQRLQGYGIGQGLVFGKRAGEYATIRASRMEKPKIDWNQVEEERRRIYGFLEHAGEDGISPLTIKNRIRRNNWKYLVPSKNEEGLKKALREVERIKREDIPRMVLRSSSKHFNYEWVEALEVPDMLLISEIMIKAALMRKETRGPFVRTDYPEKNDKEWLKHIVVRQEDGNMKFYTEPVKLLYVKPN